MTQIEIIEEFKKLPRDQRFDALEKMLHLIHEESGEKSDLAKKLERAAKMLLPDYAAGSELTNFTSLDSENFHV
jgi:recombinational DNA repair protein RecR